MPAVTSVLAATGTALGVVNLGATLYRDWLRPARLTVDHVASYMAPHGSDALIYQVNVRLAAWHKDVYIHDIWLANERSTADALTGRAPYDRAEVTRLAVPRFRVYIENVMLVDLELDEYLAQLEAAAPIPTRDLRIPAGGILTVTISELLCQPAVPANVRKHGWWLTVDYGASRVRQKVFTDL